MAFNIIDGFFIFLIGLSAFIGWQRGFILSLLDLLRWIMSLLAGLLFYRHLAELFNQVNDWTEVWNQPLAFLVIVVLVRILIQMASNQLLLRRLSKETHQNRINQLFGIFPGLLSGIFSAVFLAALFFSIPLSDNFQEKTRESVLADYFAGYAEEIETAMSPIFGRAVEQTLNRLIIKPESNERVELLFKVAETRPLPELEAKMLELVNRERTASGLVALSADPELTEVARRHSADMFARGYFSHNTPEGRDPFERIRQANVRYITAGENLALAPTLQIAHTGLMNSPGHRANILRPQFGRVGIGIMDGGRRGIMVTQNFRN